MTITASELAGEIGAIGVILLAGIVALWHQNRRLGQRLDACLEEKGETMAAAAKFEERADQLETRMGEMEAAMVAQHEELRAMLDERVPAKPKPKPRAPRSRAKPKG